MTCAANTTTTATTNSASPNAATSDRTQQFNADLIGQVNTGVTVSGVGLDLITTKVGGGISFTNAGTVSTTSAPSVLQLDGNGGAISYSGAGSIVSSTTGASGLVANNTGAGNITLTMTGGQIGASGSRVGRGIVATTPTGGINITAGQIFSVFDAITAQVTGGGSGGITVVANGAINTPGGNALPVIGTTIFGGSGNSSITLNANINTSGHGVSETSSSTGTMTVSGTGAILTNGGGTALTVLNTAAITSGDITINTGGAFTAGGGGNGIVAQITNAANNANISVTHSGTISGQVPIIASTVGGGNVTVTTSNTLFVAGAGPTAVSATTTSGTATVDMTGGTVTGGGLAATTTSGNAVVNITGGSITGTGATGVAATTTSGNILIDTTGGLVGAGGARVGSGIVASTASGAINITAGQIFSVFDAITAQVTGGGSGGITVVANGAVNTPGGGVLPVIGTSIVGGTGNSSITLNANINTSGHGVSEASSSTGTMTVSGTGGILTNGGGTALTVSNSAAITSGDITINTSGAFNAGGGGYGILAQITNAANNANISVTHSGTISGQVPIIASTVGGGNVTVTTSNTLFVAGAGPTAVSATTTNGTSTIDMTGGTVTGGGLAATTTSGNAIVNITGGSITGTGATGVAATTTSGNILVDTTGGLVGTGGGRVGRGIVASTASGAINITAGQISSVFDAITAQVTGGGSGGITVVANGAINTPGGGVLPVIGTSIVGGTGNSSITLNANVNTSGLGVSEASSSTGTMTVSGTGGIVTNGGGTALTVSNSAAITSGDITINTSGAFNAGGGGYGILAQITNAANNANISVTHSGTISGQVPIIASTVGGGNVTVTTSNTLFVAGAGPTAVSATTTNGTSTIDMTGGTVTGGGLAATTTSGNAIVNITGGSITGTGATGVAATTTSGNILVDTTGGLVGTGGGRVGRGIVASTASGAINITAGQISSVFDAITAQVTGGGSGGITVVANGAINTPGGGVLPVIGSSIVGGTGNSSITLNANVNTSGLGVSEASSSTGTMTVSGAGGIVTNGGGTALTVSNSAAVTSGDITINTSGAFSSGGTGYGILAQITNAANNANISVTHSGTISSRVPIMASTVGGGNVTINTSNNLTVLGGATAISTTTTSGTGTVNINGGTVQALGGDGVDATATSGKSVVNNTGTITAGLIGVQLIGGNANAVNNSGAIGGVTGIVTTAGATRVFNSGTVSGTGGTAIQFAGSGNTLTIAPTSVITGNAVGAGADAFQLGGTGTGSFNSALIGPAAQYRGFASYNKVDASIWTLTGTNALALPWTVQQGTLNVAGSLANSPFTIQAGTLSVTGTIGATTVNGGQFSMLAGGIGGPVIANAGSSTIAGTVGAATVNGGLFSVVAGGLGAAVTANGGTSSIDGTVGPFTLNGGLLMGNGTLGGLTVNGGTVAPGHSIGTLNVNGNFSFSGGFYQVETNLAGQSDKILATGTAALSGGTVQVIAQSGAYSSAIVYTILTANGGRTGAFSGATSNLPFLTATLSYDANDVFLSLSRNPTFFRDQGSTPNQRSVGGALDQFPVTNPVFLAAAGLTGASTRQALDALSGEIHASLQTTLVNDSIFMREAVQGRLRQSTFSGANGTMAALGAGGSLVAYAEPADAYASAGRPVFPVKALPFAVQAPVPDMTWWSQGIGSGGKISGNGNAADLSRSLAGFFTGVDRRFGDYWRAGIAGGYTNSSISVDARASAANIDTAHLAAYAGANYGSFNLRSGAAVAWSNIGTSRSVQFPGFIDNTSAHYGASTSQVFGEVGYAKTFGNKVAVEPFAGLAYVHLDSGSFVEAGGGAALAGARAADDVGYSSLGVRLAESFALANGMTILPRASAYWQHAIGNLTPGTAFTFLGTGAGFSVAGVPLALDVAVVESGFDLQLNPRAKIGVSYFGQLAPHLNDHAVKGKFTWNF